MDKKKLLIVDASVFQSIAVDMAEHFSQTFYCSPSYHPYPKIDKEKFLSGFEKENITLVREYLSVIDECDIVYVPDGGFGALVEYWQKHGKNIFGTTTIEWIEDDRWRARKEFIKLGLEQIKAVKVVGVEDLRDYLEGQENKWVKISNHRGTAETHHHIDWFNSSYWIEQVLTPALGAKADDEVFVIEDDMPGIEIGIDTVCIEGEYADKCIIGFEIKDKGNVSKIVDYKDVPEEIRNICTKLSPLLKEAKYRNQFSLEIRISEKDGKYYLVDPCPRAAFPAGTIVRNVMENFAEVVENGSQGKMIPIRMVDAKYAVELVLNSETAKHNNLPIEIPKDVFPFVKLRTFMRKEDDVYECIPYIGSECIGSIVAWGNTIEECIELIHDRFDKLKCFDLEADFSALETNGLEIIKKAKKMGIQF
jgi:hypothetical protein